ncbi:hypothetical protein [Acetobacterium bakii]|uniref:hypothetical protein n=1 Tax=Acetobacterium bakii TaxID=52689 RepID=UPI000E0EDC8C|nr:hypothetical protein [Acetobacterium bakii]
MKQKSSHIKAKKLLSILLISFFSLMLMTLTSGCVEKDLINDPVTGVIDVPENMASLHDGRYTASTEFYDTRGYAQQLDFNIKNGVITQVSLREISKDNLDRLTQEGTEKTWNGLETLTLGSLYFHLYSGFLLTQNPNKIETIAGATQTSERFISLAKTGLEQAGKGNHDPVKIQTKDTYIVRSQVDPDGYQGVLTATFNGDVLSSLAYDEIRIEDEKSKMKLMDTQNQQIYKSLFTGFTQDTLNSQNLNPVFTEGELTPEKFKYIETLKLLKDSRTKY